MNDIAKTYDEWNAIGLSPYKGQRHTGRNEYGVCTFTLDQVGIKDRELFERAQLERRANIDATFKSVMCRNINELRKDMRHE